MVKDKEPEPECNLENEREQVKESRRTRKRPKYLEDYDLGDQDNEVNLMTALSAGSLPSEGPQSFKEAEEDGEWRKAIREELRKVIREELDLLKENETWRLVEPHEDTDIGMFKEKEANCELVKKARLVFKVHDK